MSDKDSTDSKAQRTEQNESNETVAPPVVNPTHSMTDSNEPAAADQSQPGKSKPGQRQQANWLKHLKSAENLARSLVATVLLVVVSIAILIAFVIELSRNTLVIEPIGVPQVLADRGYTGEILSRRLIDEYIKIRTEAKTQKDALNQADAPDSLTNPVALPEGSLTDIQIPGASLSLRSVIRFLKESFGTPDRRISGEVVEDDSGLTLRLRQDKGEVFEDVKVHSTKEIDELLHLGARELMKAINPYVLASYLKEIDPNESLEVIAYCLANEPKDDDSWAYNLRGRIFESQKKFERALKQYDKAIDEDPNFFLAYSNAGITLSNLAIEDRGEDRDTKELQAQAEERHKKAVLIAPDDPYVYTSWALSLNLKGDQAGAIAKYKKAIDIDPDDAFAWNEWGRILKSQGDSNSALEKFEHVVKLLPRSATANNNYGNELRNVDRFEESQEYLERAIKLDNNYAFAYYNLGLLHYIRENPEKALACYDKALAVISEARKQQVYKDRNKLLAKYGNTLTPADSCTSVQGELKHDL